jgi:hypothetical protein
MHELRSIVAGGGRAELLARRAPKRKVQDEGPSLAALTIPRTESRSCNQRREDRHLNVVERAELTFRRRRYDVAVVNVSKNGAMVEADLEPRIGEKMEIRFDGCNKTACAVRWVRGSRIGVEFARETVVLAPAQVKEAVVAGRREGEAPAPKEKPRRTPRQSLLWKAVLHWDHGTTQVRVRNISADGAMLETGTEIPADTAVVLDLGDGGAPMGCIRWARGGHLGLRFDHRFDLRNLVRQAPVAEASPAHVKPQYLETELDPDSPWAAAWDKFVPEDL